MPDDAAARRWVRYCRSWAAPLAILLAAGLVLAPAWERSRREQRLISRIENELGGHVDFEQGRLARWLAERTRGGVLPLSLRGRAVSVGVAGCEFDDEFLDELTSLPHLRLQILHIHRSITRPRTLTPPAGRTSQPSADQ